MASNIELFGKLANMVDEENKSTLLATGTTSAAQGEQTDAEKAGASAEPDETAATQITATAPATEPTTPETTETTTTTNE